MPKILWMSPFSLHDISSGAAIHCHTILESLHKSGFEVWALSSLTFVHPNGGNFFLNELGPKLNNNPQMLFKLNDKGVQYLYVRSSQHLEPLRTALDQQSFYEHFCEVLDSYRPDLVMGFGTSMDAFTCFAEAKRRHIPTVYFLLNSTHGHFSFPHIDLVLTDSKASAELYASRDKINTSPIGQFVDLRYIRSPKRTPNFITMINPSPNKGLAIFAAIAKYCATEHPDWKFLVVNSGANFIEQLPQLHTKGKSEEHTLQPDMFPNVMMTDATYDMRLIYAQTKLLLAPSLSFETWNRTISEAICNDIPVLTHPIGGLNEAIGAAGIAIKPPEHCLKDMYSLPDKREVKAYVAALEEMQNKDYSNEIAEQKRSLDITVLTEHLIGKLQPLFSGAQRYLAH